MTQEARHNEFVNTESRTVDVSVDDTTAVVLCENNPDRISFAITNNKPQDVWVRFYPAGDDDLMHGIRIDGNDTRVFLNVRYVGEISAIRSSGAASDVTCTEW